MKEKTLSEKIGNVEVEYKKCIICEKEFPIRKNKNGRRIKGAVLRQSNSITCSEKCSKVYLNCYRYIFQKFNRRRKQTIKRLKEKMLERFNLDEGDLNSLFKEEFGEELVEDE